MIELWESVFHGDLKDNSHCYEKNNWEMFWEKFAKVPTLVKEKYGSFRFLFMISWLCAPWNANKHLYHAKF